MKIDKPERVEVLTSGGVVTAEIYESRGPKGKAIACSIVAPKSPVLTKEDLDKISEIAADVIRKREHRQNLATTHDLEQEASHEPKT